MIIIHLLSIPLLEHKFLERRALSSDLYSPPRAIGAQEIFVE
jgi:hypothetical protein